MAPDSNVETFVAMRLAIDNWRWAGVPFYLRTGKRMSRRYTEIAIRFKHAPYAPFEDTHVEELPPNWLVLRIQPDEGISLQFEVKRPGPVVDLAAVRMDFSYRDWFPREPNVGYETLIYDCMIGDQTLFQRADMVEETWRVVQPVLDAWAAKPPAHFPNYAAGSDGPHAADDAAAARRPHMAPRGNRLNPVMARSEATLGSRRIGAKQMSQPSHASSSGCQEIFNRVGGRGAARVQSVFPPRSSNRTCGFRAFGSPTVSAAGSRRGAGSAANTQMRHAHWSPCVPSSPARLFVVACGDSGGWDSCGNRLVLAWPFMIYRN